MKKPTFLINITHLGPLYWVEIEGFEKMVRKQAGAFAFVEDQIMEWGCENLGEVLKKHREVNFAPRMRIWVGEEPPTDEERKNGEWRDDQRAWMPSFEDMNIPGRYAEWTKTGRTNWED